MRLAPRRKQVMDYCQSVLNSLRPYMGLIIISQQSGLFVDSVTDDGPAFRAGFKPEDIITSVYRLDGPGPAGSSDNEGRDAKIFQSILPGYQVRFLVRRGGEDVAISLSVPAKHYSWQEITLMRRALRGVIAPQDFNKLLSM